MAALQYLRGTSATVTETFQVDGVPTDLDGGAVPTVVALFPDGTALDPAPTATHVGATGSGTYQIVLNAQPEVTYLDPITWTGTIGSKQQVLRSRAEWVGEFLFTLAALRDVKVAGAAPFNATDYPNSVVTDRRVQVTDDFEARTGWSFVPRFTRERHSGDGSGTLIVRQYKPGALLSVTVDGTAQTLADFDLLGDGELRWHGGTFPTTRPGNVWVEYVRGWDRPPAEVSDRGLARTAMLLLPSLAGSTVSTWTTPDGTTYSYDQAGQSLAGGGRRHYGVPAIDATLNDPAYNARGGVFA